MYFRIVLQHQLIQVYLMHTNHAKYCSDTVIYSVQLSSIIN
jgi:hypothetical protein